MASWNLGRIRDPGAADFRKGRERMNLAAGSTHDVLSTDSPDQQGVGDERTMAAPGHRLSAHQCNPILLRQPDQFAEALLKFRRQHVIRETPEGGVAPAQADRIAFRMTQAAESRQVNVFHSSFLQCAGQRSLVELRIVPGPRHRAHIDDKRYSVRLEQADEFLERARGMANRQREG